MNMRIGEWGGSYAVRLPLSIVEELGLEKGQELAVQVSGDTLILKPKRTTPSLEALCALARTQMAPAIEWDDAPLDTEWPDE